MPTKDLQYTVNLPTIDEFGERFPQYKRYAMNEGRFLYELIISPESFIHAKTITLILELPALTAIADACWKAVASKGSSDNWDFQKQFIGAVVCKLMEDNGFEKKGQKKSVPIDHFTKGEVYRLKN
jgi:hypothetical protein